MSIANTGANVTRDELYDSLLSAPPDLEHTLGAAGHRWAEAHARATFTDQVAPHASAGSFVGTDEDPYATVVTKRLRVGAPDAVIQAYAEPAEADADLELKGQGDGGRVRVSRLSTTGDVDVTGGLQASGDLTVNGDATVAGDLAVSGAVTVGDTIRVQGDTLDVETVNGRALRLRRANGPNTGSCRVLSTEDGDGRSYTAITALDASNDPKGVLRLVALSNLTIDGILMQARARVTRDLYVSGSCFLGDNDDGDLSAVLQVRESSRRVDIDGELYVSDTVTGKQIYSNDGYFRTASSQWQYFTTSDGTAFYALNNAGYVPAVLLHASDDAAYIKVHSGPQADWNLRLKAKGAGTVRTQSPLVAEDGATVAGDLAVSGGVVGLSASGDNRINIQAFDGGGTDAHLWAWSDSYASANMRVYCKGNGSVKVKSACALEAGATVTGDLVVSDAVSGSVVKSNRVFETTGSHEVVLTSTRGENLRTTRQSDATCYPLLAAGNGFSRLNSWSGSGSTGDLLLDAGGEVRVEKPCVMEAGATITGNLTVSGFVSGAAMRTTSGSYQSDPPSLSFTGPYGHRMFRAYQNSDNATPYIYLQSRDFAAVLKVDGGSTDEDMHIQAKGAGEVQIKHACVMEQGATVTGNLVVTNNVTAEGAFLAQTDATVVGVLNANRIRSTTTQDIQFQQRVNGISPDRPMMVVRVDNSGRFVHDYLEITATTFGNPVSLAIKEVAGNATDVDLDLVPKGSGVVRSKGAFVSEGPVTSSRDFISTTVETRLVGTRGIALRTTTHSGADCYPLLVSGFGFSTILPWAGGAAYGDMRISAGSGRKVVIEKGTLVEGDLEVSGDLRSTTNTMIIRNNNNREMLELQADTGNDDHVVIKSCDGGNPCFIGISTGLLYLDVDLDLAAKGLGSVKVKNQCALEQGATVTGDLDVSGTVATNNIRSPAGGLYLGTATSTRLWIGGGTNVGDSSRLLIDSTTTRVILAARGSDNLDLSLYARGTGSVKVESACEFKAGVTGDLAVSGNLTVSGGISEPKFIDNYLLWYLLDGNPLESNEGVTFSFGGPVVGTLDGYTYLHPTDQKGIDAFLIDRVDGTSFTLCFWYLPGAIVTTGGSKTLMRMRDITDKSLFEVVEDFGGGNLRLRFPCLGHATGYWQLMSPSVESEMNSYMDRWQHIAMSVRVLSDGTSSRKAAFLNGTPWAPQSETQQGVGTYGSEVIDSSAIKTLYVGDARAAVTDKSYISRVRLYDGLCMNSAHVLQDMQRL